MIVNVVDHFMVHFQGNAFFVFTYEFFQFHHATKVRPDTAKKRQPGQ